MLSTIFRTAIFQTAILNRIPRPDVVCFEKDLLTGKILSHLHPESKVEITGFEDSGLRYLNRFDITASNIPFGDVAVFDPAFTKSKSLVRQHAAKSLHNYFFLKGLDNLREGGILAYITSQGVLDSPVNEDIRYQLMQHSHLISAIRLPNNLFTDGAGTEVGSDLIILQKEIRQGQNRLPKTNKHSSLPTNYRKEST